MDIVGITITCVLSSLVFKIFEQIISTPGVNMQHLDSVHHSAVLDDQLDASGLVRADVFGSVCLAQNHDQLQKP